MVLIPAGPFIMGSDSDDPDEAPQQEADMPAFEIDLFEVTNAQFAAFVEGTGYQTDAEKGGETGWRGFYTEGKDNHPVVKVSWNDAVAYCEWQRVGCRSPEQLPVGIPGDDAGGQLSRWRQPIRRFRHGRQRLGMDVRLVSTLPRQQLPGPLFW
jgi:hypothetical protein